MSNGSFYEVENIRPLYKDIVPAYQAAFADEPWREVSKCIDEDMRCVGGFSPLEIGAVCVTCGKCPEEPAYESEELIGRFEQLTASRPTCWYIEQAAGGIALAAVSWRAEPSLIATEKYGDAPYMVSWISETLNGAHLAWLDEVFANKQLRATGNLRGFGTMCNGFMERLETNVLAFRTVNERMIAAAYRDFDGQVQVFEKNIEVPDRRDFVIIERK